MYSLGYGLYDWASITDKDFVPFAIPERFSAQINFMSSGYQKLRPLLKAISFLFCPASRNFSFNQFYLVLFKVFIMHSTEVRFRL
jgi:hypothetical protein